MLQTMTATQPPTPAPQRPEAISIQRAAGLLDVHEDTVRRWIKSGRLEAHRVGPKLWRIPRDVIARLRKKR